MTAPGASDLPSIRQSALPTNAFPPFKWKFSDKPQNRHVFRALSSYTRKVNLDLIQKMGFQTAATALQMIQTLPGPLLFQAQSTSTADIKGEGSN